MISIREPIWKTRSVGIAEHHLLAHKQIRIEILYKDTLGKRLFPYIYCIESNKALGYPVQVRRGVRLRIVPIGELTVKG